MARLLRQNSHAPKRSVHMQPQILLLAKLRNLFERIDGAGVDRPGAGYHTSRIQTSLAVFFDLLRQFGNVHSEFGVDGDFARIVVPDPQ